MNKVICISCQEECFEDDLKLCADCDEHCCGNCISNGLCYRCIDAALCYAADEGTDEPDDLSI